MGPYEILLFRNFAHIAFLPPDSELYDVWTAMEEPQNLEPNLWLLKSSNATLLDLFQF